MQLDFDIGVYCIVNSFVKASVNKHRELLLLKKLFSALLFGKTLLNFDIFKTFFEGVREAG